MDISSVILISLLGGIILVFAIQNIKYNKGRDLAYQAYRTAVGMLRTEFEENLDLTNKTRNEIVTCNLPKDRLQTQQWEKLLAGPSLAQMDEDASSDLRHIYVLIEEAETCRSRLIDASNQESEPGGSAEYRDNCQTSLLRILDEVETKIRTHLARVK